MTDLKSFLVTIDDRGKLQNSWQTSYPEQSNHQQIRRQTHHLENRILKLDLQWDEQSRIEKFLQIVGYLQVRRTNFVTKNPWGWDKTSVKDWCTFWMFILPTSTWLIWINSSQTTNNQWQNSNSSGIMYQKWFVLLPVWYRSIIFLIITFYVQFTLFVILSLVFLIIHILLITIIILLVIISIIHLILIFQLMLILLIIQTLLIHPSHFLLIHKIFHILFN